MIINFIRYCRECLLDANEQTVSSGENSLAIFYYLFLIGIYAQQVLRCSI